MLFSRYGALMGLLGAAQASAVQPGSVVVRSEEHEVRSSDKACSYDIGRTWKDDILYSGVAAAATADLDAVHVGLALTEAALVGSVDIEVEDSFLLNPTIKVSLAGIQAYLKVALDATAGVSESVELFSDTALDLAVPGLAEIDINVGIALDLVFSVSAAIDLETVFNIQFGENSYLEIDILSKEIVNTELADLTVQSTPTSIGSEIDLTEDIELNVALRLRAGLAIDSEIDIIGLDIGAGAEVAIWVNIFEYTNVFSQISSTTEVQAKESFSLTAGVAVELDVEIDEITLLSLAPSIVVTIATAETVTVTVAIGSGSQEQWGWREGTNTATYTSTGYISGATNAPAGSNSLPSGSSPDVSGASPDATGSSPAAGSSVPTTTVQLATGSNSPSSLAGAISAPESSSATLPAGMTTSTVTTTNVYTITSCAASVSNCPNSYTQQVVTSVVQEYTTICPVTATQTGSPAASGSGSGAVPALPTASSTAGALTGSGPSSSVPLAAESSAAAIPGTESSAAAIPGTESSAVPSVPAGETTAAGVTSAPAVATSSASVSIPSATSPATMTSLATPTTSTITIPSTATTPNPTVVISDSTTICPVTATETGAGSKPTSSSKPTGVAGNAAVPTGAFSAPSWPSGVAAPSGFAPRPQAPANGTVARPSGALVSVPPAAATSGVSASSSSSPSGIVEASGAGKVTFGVLAAFAPLFVALM